MLAFQLSFLSAIELENAGQKNSKIDLSALKPIAPYNKNTSLAAQNCFDRETGKSISSKLLKTYREALAQYHLSPESKFLNGERLDFGITRRRHVEAVSINHIGKEANNWEKQSYLGYEERERISYGTAPKDLKEFVNLLKETAKKIGQRKLAKCLGISRRTLDGLLKGNVRTRMKKKVGSFLIIMSELN